MGVGQVSETSGGGIAGVRTRGRGCPRSGPILLRSSSGGGRAPDPHVGRSGTRMGRPHSGKAYGPGQFLPPSANP